jgi:hypothetical protein
MMYKLIYAANSRSSTMQSIPLDLSGHQRLMPQPLALHSGRRPSALIREAYSSDLEGQSSEGFLARLHQARGIWAGREDQPSSSGQRRELFHHSMAGHCWPFRSPRMSCWWMPSR